MTIYDNILESIGKREKLLAVLIDPEKIEFEKIQSFIQLVNASIATHIFVGGSTDEKHQIHNVVSEIKKHTILPVVLFPGDARQITDNADGVLFLSLLSGRNPEYLIEQQVSSAMEVFHSNLEVLPTGYILIDGGKETSVQRVSQTKPIQQSHTDLILRTALAGQYSGKQLIYLEAGSGATRAVGQEVIQFISKNLEIPLIVGGGIRNIEQLESAYNAGADMVVIGTAFEKDETFLNQLKKSLDLARDNNFNNENIG